MQAIGRWVALNRDELMDDAPPAIVPHLLTIEQTYYRLVDGEATVPDLVAALKALRDAWTASQPA